MGLEHIVIMIEDGMMNDTDSSMIHTGEFELISSEE